MEICDSLQKPAPKDSHLSSIPETLDLDDDVKSILILIFYFIAFLLSLDIK
jgi:hypothetical protein